MRQAPLPLPPTPSPPAPTVPPPAPSKAPPLPTPPQLTRQRRRQVARCPCRQGQRLMRLAHALCVRGSPLPRGAGIYTALPASLLLRSPRCLDPLPAGPLHFLQRLDMAGRTYTAVLISCCHPCPSQCPCMGSVAMRGTGTCLQRTSQHSRPLGQYKQQTQLVPCRTSACKCAAAAHFSVPLTPGSWGGAQQWCKVHDPEEHQGRVLQGICLAGVLRAGQQPQGVVHAGGQAAADQATAHVDLGSGCKVLKPVEGCKTQRARRPLEAWRPHMMH